MKPSSGWIYLGLAIILFSAVIDWVASLASWDWPPDDLPFLWAFIGVAIVWAGHVRLVRWEERERYRLQRSWDAERREDEEAES